MSDKNEFEKLDVFLRQNEPHPSPGSDAKGSDIFLEIEKRGQSNWLKPLMAVAVAIFALAFLFRFDLPIGEADAMTFENYIEEIISVDGAGLEADADDVILNLYEEINAEETP